MANVRRNIADMVRTEWARQVGWTTSYREQLGSLSGFAELRDLVTDLQRESIRSGIPFSNVKANAAVDALGRIIARHVDNAVGTLSDDAPGVPTLADVSVPERWAAIREWEIALPLVAEFLNEIDASVGTNTDIAAISESIERGEGQIEPLLADMVQAVVELEGPQ